MAKIKDLTGKTSGLLTAVKLAEGREPSNGCAYWECVCECGGRKIVNSNHFIFKQVKSCGCLRRKHGKYSNKNT